MPAHHDSAQTSIDVRDGAMHRPRTIDARLAMLAVRMGYVALSVFFACFYAAEGYLELIDEHSRWKPAGIHHPTLEIGIAEALVLVLGALAWQWIARRRETQAGEARMSPVVWLPATCAAISLLLHLVELHHPGFTLQSSAYASVFVALESVFTVTLVGFTIALCAMTNRMRIGAAARAGVGRAAMGELWLWLAAVALLNFAALYVQPFL